MLKYLLHCYPFDCPQTLNGFGSIYCIATLLIVLKHLMDVGSIYCIATLLIVLKHLMDLEVFIAYPFDCPQTLNGFGSIYCIATLLIVHKHLMDLEVFIALLPF